MKIKQRKTTPSSVNKAREYFKERKYLIRGALGAGSLITLALLFTAVMGLGAYLTKTGHTSYTKPTLLQISELDFSFLHNYLKGKRNKFDKVELSLDRKELSRVRQVLEKAVEEGRLREVLEKAQLPGRLTYNGKKYDVQVTLNNTLPIHIETPANWSFHVEATGAETIEGMKSFDLLLPSTGTYLANWMAVELMKARGLHAAKGDFVKLVINGASHRIYFLQERFDKSYYQGPRFQEGILFDVESGLTIYDEARLRQDPALEVQVVTLLERWEGLRTGRLAPQTFFNLRKMGKSFAILDLVNQNRPSFRGALSFHLNPRSGMVEPVIRKFREEPGGSNPYRFSSLLEKTGVEEPWLPGCPQDSVIRLITEQLEFQRAYIRGTADVSQREFLDELLSRKGEKLSTLLERDLQPGGPAQDLAGQIKVLLGKAKYLRYLLLPDQAEIMAWFNRAGQDSLGIYLQNQQDLPLEVLHLSWRDSLLFYPERPVILHAADGAEPAAPSLYNFQIPPSASWTDTLLPELKIHYRMLGMHKVKRAVLVFPWAFDERLEYAANPAARNGNYKAFDFVKEEKDGKTLIIPAGAWTIAEDMIIPAGKKLLIRGGARVDLRNQAKIISYAPVSSLGEEKQPVVFHSSDTTAEGLIVIQARDRSTLQHTVFKHLSCPVDGGWRLSGAVTFYESPVDINYCTFYDNRRGDDYLNIIRSDFTIDHARFESVNADAFDCDFCDGSITNSSFIKIGNDGIDVSGTKLEISHINMEAIGDKGLSAGENSAMTARWIDIRNAEIAVTSKDQSTIALSDAQITNARIGITLFQKKSEFGPGFLTGERIAIQNSEIPYLVEGNSELTIDGAVIPPNKQDVKLILYGVEYGKSSK